MLEYSLVIPVYNEEESLLVLFREMKNVMQGLKRPHEIIFVNDGSSDRTTEIIKKFNETDSDIVKVLHLNQRRGQTFAMKTGLLAARGNIIFTLDADLQNDPADIPRLLEKMKEGYDCICGWRKAREDSWLKATLSKLGNFLQRCFTGLKIHDVSCTLRAYQRDCVDKIALNWEGQHRFMPLSLSLQGYKVGEIILHHRKRQFGVSKYSHQRIFRVIVDFFRILGTKGRA